jgi:tRNA(Arg) A34 adenosine deaminase TadA
VPDHLELMQHAIDAARTGIAAGQSPFGAAIGTRAGVLVVAAHNRVRADKDITAHAEIMAIRAACARLGAIDLSGHIMATTCEPCPMCASAIHWARLDEVVYGAAIADAARAGFRELSIPADSLYRQGGSPVRVTSGVMRDACVELFDLWQRGSRPEPY